MPIQPSQKEFQKLTGKLKPCWLEQKITRKDSHAFTLNLFEKLKESRSILLFSGKRGRYSFLGIRPFAFLEYQNKQTRLNAVVQKNAPLEILRKLLKKYKTPKCKNLPPFYAGALGFLGYEAFTLFENIPKVPQNDLKLPEIYFAFFDEVIVVDHRENKLFLVGTAQHYTEAQNKVKTLVTRLNDLDCKKNQASEKTAQHISTKNNQTQINSNFSQTKYYQAIDKVKEYLQAGDTFQVNLSQRLEQAQLQNSYTIFKKLSKLNPSPFAAYLEHPDFQIVSCSPERLIRLKNKKLFTQPIAGTRRRGQTHQEDMTLAKALKNSDKEMAEHTMLVDLLRNDLGRISEYGSVVTQNFAHIEKYSHVQHLVSNVYGKIKTGLDILDVLRAVFPGGTITGAPKIRTMEIISELEPNQRGPYTGSLGYVGFDGNADLNILIRTIVCTHQKMYIQVGGGIVMDSDSKREYQETWHKATAMLEAVTEQM